MSGGRSSCVALLSLPTLGTVYSTHSSRPPRFQSGGKPQVKRFSSVRSTLHQLRQQGRHRPGVPNRSLVDFVAPVGSGLADHVGAFAVSTGLGAQERVAAFKADHDDYNAILLESLADRLAEAFAERLHERVRTQLWGYAPQEQLAAEGLLAESYRGIRPAPGYPACPDHTEKAAIWDLLDVEARTGITLTESMAMYASAQLSRTTTAP